MISGADDPVLRPEGAEGMEAFVPDLEKHVIERCGHWTQQEQPERLNQLIIDWLRRRF
jgi:pimeloyl-ACP methyl ester carboxylesterase